MWSFVAGVLFISFAYPALESLTAVAMTKLELQKGEDSLKLAKINKEIKKYVDEEDCEKSHPIGFSISSKKENEEDADEDL